MNWLVNASKHPQIQIPILILLCVGLLALSPWRRRPGWWVMAAGLLLMLLGWASQELILQVQADSFLGTVMPRLAQLREIWLLLFALGFAMTGAAVIRDQRAAEEQRTDEAAKPRGGKGGQKS